MTVPVVNVRVMGVAVRDDDMLVGMAVLASATPVGLMYMLVMRIMTVRMFMLHFLMDMLMCMLLGQVQPHSNCH